MRHLTTTVLIATLSLSACGSFRDSRANPSNWFGNGRSQPAQADPQAETNPLIPQNERGGLFRSLRNPSETYGGRPVDQVSGLVIERLPGGAIVRATGISSYDSPYNVRLSPANGDAKPVDGVLTFRLEAVLPAEVSRTTSQRVRTVTAAVRLSDRDLRGVRVIRVEGARNAQTSNRR